MLNIFKSPKKPVVQTVHKDETSLLVKQFNGLNIQVYGTYEEPLFKAKDIGDLLDIKNIRDTVSVFTSKQRCVVLTDTAYGQKEVIYRSKNPQRSARFKLL
jgi:prophage antirepressor-like protein